MGWFGCVFTRGSFLLLLLLLLLFFIILFLLLSCSFLPSYFLVALTVLPGNEVNVWNSVFHRKQLSAPKIAKFGKQNL